MPGAAHAQQVRILISAQKRDGPTHMYTTKRQMNIVFEFLLLGAIAAGCVVVFKVLSARIPHNKAYKYGVGLALVAGFLLFWVNAAVGIIGSENNDANMMYGGVLAIAFFGSISARFRPRGMTITLFATALAQVLVAVIALTAGLGVSGPIWPRDVLVLTAFFAALWIGSALLFRKAAALEQPSADAGKYS